MSELDDASPKKTVHDNLHSAAKGALSLVPYVGGALSLAFEELVRPPISRRRDEWMSDIYLRLRKLEESDHSIDVDLLVQDDAFLSILVRASRQALETHEAEKLAALRNAVLNSAYSATDEQLELRQLYLSRIEQLRPAHIRILSFLTKPENHASDAQIRAASARASRTSFVTSLLSDMRGREDFVEVVLNDLARLDLIEAKPVVSGPRSGTRPTDFGAGLVQFISDQHDLPS